jgi:hypothetical protein
MPRIPKAPEGLTPNELAKWPTATPTVREGMRERAKKRRAQQKAADKAKAQRLELERQAAEARAARLAEHQRARTEWQPHMDLDKVPAGYAPRGVTIKTDGEGNVQQVYYKTGRDKQSAYDVASEVAAGLVAGGLQTLPELPPPTETVDDLLTVYPLGDPHIGLYCWAKECGHDFDLNIAEKQYLAVASRLFSRTPKGSDALIIELGDFFHADDPLYRTSSGKNTVDVDTRYVNVIAVGIRIMATLVNAALERHRNVTLWCVRGNHDDRSTITLREAIRGIFMNNPRVTVDSTPGKHHGLEFGKNLILASHGDSLKGKRDKTMHEIATSDYRREWGRTDHGYAYVGHVHHESKGEVGGFVTETFRTLAPKDAWHAAQGYRSGRDVRADVWHRDYGRSTTHIVSIAEIEEAMRDAAT